MKISFKVVKVLKKKGKELLVAQDIPDTYLGEYEVQVLTAQRGINALDELIAENDEFKENPKLITPEIFSKKMVEAATLKDNKPIDKINLEQMPAKLWRLLVLANQKLNGLSDDEAAFLLEPSYSKKAQSIQQ